MGRLICFAAAGLSFILACNSSSNQGKILTENIQPAQAPLLESFPLETVASTEGKAISNQKMEAALREHYLGRSLPVTVNDSALQASLVTFTDDRAVVAYNAEGPCYAGALQVIQVGKSCAAKVAKVLAQIHFSNMEISAIYYDPKSREVVLGGQADGNYFGFYGWISKVRIDDVSAGAIVKNLKQLSCYTVTSISKTGDRFVVGTGVKGEDVEMLDVDLNPVHALARKGGLEKGRHA